MFADEVVASSKGWQAPLLRTAVRFDATPVMKLVGLGPLPINSLPCIRPPWETCFAWIGTGRIDVSLLGWLVQVEASVESSPVDTITVSPWLRVRGEPLPVNGWCRIHFDSLGAPTGTSVQEFYHKSLPDDLRLLLRAAFGSLLLAFCLCHMKREVQVVDCCRRGRRGLRGARIGADWKTIDVDGVLRRVQAEAPGNEEAEARTRRVLHMVRGHFMRTKGGLVTWRRQHLRGDAAVGFSGSDYRLPP